MPAPGGEYTVHCFFRCESCSKEAPAVRKGYNYVVPEGWYVVSDSPTLKGRTIEHVVCSANCAGAKLVGYPESETVSYRQITREVRR